MIVFEASTNSVIIPEDDHTKIMQKFGHLSFHPDYTIYLENLAVFASRQHGKLKIAPPYGAWLRANFQMEGWSVL